MDKKVKVLSDLIKCSTNVGNYLVRLLFTIICQSDIKTTLEHSIHLLVIKNIMTEFKYENAKAAVDIWKKTFIL